MSDDLANRLRTAAEEVEPLAWGTLTPLLREAAERIEDLMRSPKTRVCKKCKRNTQAPLFDGCMNANCPHGFKPCY